jgi:hypothetical protein
MEKYLCYKITHDSGFAPNPFWGYLTLAACTPNHMKASLVPGDWIIGVESKSLANQRKRKGCNIAINQSLIYAAKINEILTLDEYFRDSRFQAKKFNKNGNWKERRGDNVYFIKNNQWRWLRCHGHEPDHLRNLHDSQVFFDVKQLDNYWKDKKMKKTYGVILQDLRGNTVFISNEFLYFGDKGINFPQKFTDCVPQRGIKYCPQNRVNDLENYLDNLIKTYRYGVHGNPINCCIYNNCNDDKYNKENKSSCKG